MSISVVCEGCGRKLAVPSQFRGKKVKCKCGQPIRVPGGAKKQKPSPSDSSIDPFALADLAEATEEAPQEEEVVAPAIRRGKRKSSKKGKKKKQPTLSVPVIASGAGAALLLIVVIVVVALQGGGEGDSSADNVAQNNNVESDQPRQVPVQNVPKPNPDQGEQLQSAPSFDRDDVLDFMPQSMKTVAVVKIREALSSLKKSQHQTRDLRQYQIATPLLPIITLTGLTLTELDQVAVGSDSGGDLLVAIRSIEPHSEEQLMQRMGCGSGKPLEGDLSAINVFPLSAHGEVSLDCACFPNPQTILLGNRSLIAAALRSSQPNQPPLLALVSQADAPAQMWFYSTGNTLMPLLFSLAGRGVDPAAIEASSGMVQRVAMGYFFQEGVQLTMALECSDDNTARNLRVAADKARAAIAKHEKDLDERKRRIEAAVRQSQGNAAGQSSGGPSASANSLWDVTKIQTHATNKNVVMVALPQVIMLGDVPSGPLDIYAAATKLTYVGNSLGRTIFPGPLRQTRNAIATFHKSQTSFPRGALEAKEMRVVQRVSWLTQLLPFLGLQDLHDQIDFTKTWSDGANIPVAVTLVEAFLDPTVPERRWRGRPFSGIALTHFVGMGGVGADAPKLPANDPRVGVFGYDRQTKLADIKDGAGSTIMMIQAQDVFGPWIQGGGATVRAAQTPPFIGSTGGFGSPQGGALTVFADGSVRLLSKEIDPDVFKALCTIQGGESVDVTQTGDLQVNELTALSGGQ